MTLVEFFEQVKEVGALEQGFSCDTLSHIDPYIVAEAFRNVSLYGWIKDDTDNMIIQAMVIDEALHIMELEEFEEVASYFLGSSNIEK